MKLQYSIIIHRYTDDDKKQDNRIDIGVCYKTKNGKPIFGEYNYCCPEMKSAFSSSFVTFAYDKRYFLVKHAEKSEKHIPCTNSPSSCSR